MVEANVAVVGGLAVCVSVPRLRSVDVSGLAGLPAAQGSLALVTLATSAAEPSVVVLNVAPQPEPLESYPFR